MRISTNRARSARTLSLALLAGSAALAGGVPAAQADLRVSQNYRLASDANPFRGSDQVALAVDPSNSQHLVETNANYLSEQCEATTSFDGGVTWSDAFSLSPPAAGIGLPFLPSCRISNHAGESMFQSVTFGSGQNVYATSITPRSTTTGEEGATAIIYKSTNGGLTWAAGVASMPGGATGAPYYELPTVAVDPGAGPGGADRVYSSAHEATGFGNPGTAPPCPVPAPPPAPPATPRCPSVQTAVSNDGGVSFAAPVRVSAPGVATTDGGSQPIISPDHSVSIAWRTSGVAGTIQVARSTDAGVSWGAPVDVTSVTGGGRSNTSHVTVVPSAGSSFPRLAGDKRNGNLYIVYGQGGAGPTAPAGGFQGADHFIAPDSQVWFQRSLNNGATWSTPKRINDIASHPGTPIVQTRHPSVSVAPDGRVDIVWEDRRHWYQGPGERDCVHTHIACDDARLGDTYYSYSTDAGATFEANRRISDRSHNNDVGFDYRFATGWAFGPQAISMSNDELLVGWMDSREGNFDDDTQDIYLAKVVRGAPASVPQTRIDQPDSASLSVALSKQAYLGGGEAVVGGQFVSRAATNVVIVNQDDVPAATAAGVLARANLGPVLLSPAGGLPAAVKTEIGRLNPTRVYLVGDAGRLSAQVAADAGAAAGLDPADAAKVTRLAGNGDAGVAAAVAAAFDRRAAGEKVALQPAFDAAVIANSAGPDYVAASALAAARRLPILYVNAGSIPAETSAALSALNIDRTLVIGDASQVSDSTMAALPGTATRLGGGDRYATSRAVVAASLSRGLPSNIVYAASGDRPMDAALLGPVVGRATGIMELTPGAASQTAASTAAGSGLTGIDRLFVVEPSPAAAAAPPTPPAGIPTPGAIVIKPAVCARPALVKRNASRIRTRVDMRLRLHCNGKLTATSTTKLRVKGRLRAVRQRTSVRKLTGFNRSIRVTLSRAAVRRLHRSRVLRVSIRFVFTPATLSATSKKSTRTLAVTIRQPKKKSKK